MIKLTHVCIPTSNEGGLLSHVSKHFGKTSYFTFIKLENGKIKEIKAIESTCRHNSGYEAPVDLMLNLKVNVLICGDLGTRSSYILRCNGIEVISGASGKVKDVLNEWKIGMLQLADENLCKNCSKESWEVIK